MNAPLRAQRQDRVNTCATSLTAGRYDLMARGYDYPFPAFLNGQQVVLTTPDAACSLFGLFHAAMQAEGLTRLKSVIVAEEIPRRGRFRIWVDLIGDGPEATGVLLARSILYCRGTPAGDRVEMLELANLSLSAFDGL